MKIYRNKENKNLYIISHLILDIYHLNCNAFAGIYAKPYNWQGEQIIFHGKKDDECMAFVNNNFDVIAEC